MLSLPAPPPRGAQLLLCLVILQNVPLSNQLCVKRDLELSSTLSAFTRILDQAEQTKGYVPGETPVVVVGHAPLFERLHGTARV